MVGGEGRVDVQDVGCECEWGSVGRYSGSVRVGGSGAQATEWTSDTSVGCKVSGGASGSLGVVVTAGELAGSETEAGSYERGVASSVWGANEGTTGSGSMTVTGTSLGTRR